MCHKSHSLLCGAVQQNLPLFSHGFFIFNINLAVCLALLLHFPSCMYVLLLYFVKLLKHYCYQLALISQLHLKMSSKFMSNYWISASTILLHSVEQTLANVTMIYAQHCRVPMEQPAGQSQAPIPANVYLVSMVTIVRWHMIIAIAMLHVGRMLHVYQLQKDSDAYVHIRRLGICVNKT